MKICVIGLGYVGLPLALAFAKNGYSVIGFDIKEKRISELKQGIDITEETSSDELKSVEMEYSSNPSCIKEADFIIVGVPTPITKNKKPDLRPLEMASKTVGENLKKGAIIVFESTVYPGVTEEVCRPIIEKYSGFSDFKLGYSPERINPGDKEHTVEKILKVVSGEDAQTLETVAKVYSDAIKAGVHKAPSIKVAEAAKVIENTQRDINIALMNELSLIFERMDIDTKDVLEAAGTKWNFLKFFPGLVGGHCIGVDPYYLAYRAEELGYHPDVILSGRKVNDYMPEHVASMAIKLLNECEKLPKKSKILVMGLTFKENVTDTRNSKISDTISKLKEYGVFVIGCDPYAEELDEFKIDSLKQFNEVLDVDGIIVACAHDEFKELSVSDLKSKISGKGFLIDIKGLYHNQDKEGLMYRSL